MHVESDHTQRTRQTGSGITLHMRVRAFIVRVPPSNAHQPLRVQLGRRSRRKTVVGAVTSHRDQVGLATGSTRTDLVCVLLRLCERLVFGESVLGARVHSREDARHQR